MGWQEFSILDWEMKKLPLTPTLSRPSASARVIQIRIADAELGRWDEFNPASGIELRTWSGLVRGVFMVLVLYLHAFSFGEETARA
jgi:hypothetical protein